LLVVKLFKVDDALLEASDVIGGSLIVVVELSSWKFWIGLIAG
jgi:hypothetical protein